MQDLIECLQRAIHDDGRTLYRLAKDADLRYSVVHRFATGERIGINLVTAAKLCHVLRLELRPKTRAAKGK